MRVEDSASWSGHKWYAVSIRQHTSAYVSVRQHMYRKRRSSDTSSAYVSIRPHTSAYKMRVQDWLAKRWEESKGGAACIFIFQLFSYVVFVYAKKKTVCVFARACVCVLVCIYTCRDIQRDTHRIIYSWSCLSTRRSAPAAPSASVFELLY